MVPHFGGCIHPCRIKTHCCAKTHAHFSTECNRVARKYLGTVISGQKRQQQSYRALTDDKYHLTGGESRLLYRLQARVHPLDKCCLFVHNPLLKTHHAPAPTQRHPPPT